MMGAQPEDPHRLYKLLEVQPDATEDDIKKAYYKLARKYHPDRNPNVGDEFKHISRAHQVLIDPYKRQIYDNYGEKVLSMVEEWDKLTTDDRLALFRECFMNMRFLLLFVLTLVCALLMLQPIFICLRVDHQVNWRWVVTLIPIWIVISIRGLTVVCCPGCVMPPTPEEYHEIVNSEEMEGKGEKSANPPNHRPFVMSPAQVLYSFLAFGLGTTFTVFLALKLDEQVKWKWLVVFAPMIVREGLNIFTFRMRGRSKFVALQPLIWRLFRVLLMVLLPLKLDKIWNANWAVVMLPLWLGSSLAMADLAHNVAKYLAKRREQYKEDSAHSRYLPQYYTLHGAVVVAVSITMALICVRVDNALPLPAMAVASPLFALVALFYSMVCLFVVYASAARACDNNQPPPEDYGQYGTFDPESGGQGGYQ